MSDQTGTRKDEEETQKTAESDPKKKKMPKEIGGPKGPEPTRYGDWERNGIATDF